MGEFSIGQSVRRREDPRLLTGRGRFYDDLKLAGELHAAIVRSPHPHADIRGIDSRAALQMPGVHAVLTGADYEADSLGMMSSMAPYKKRDGGAMYLPRRTAIAVGRVMHVGYPVAVVVADTLELARDAAERVEIDYAPRPAVVNARDAFEPGAPQLYDDCPNNEAYFYQAGNKIAVDEAFARAAHVIEQRLVINRVTANTLEPRGVTGEYDGGTGRYTLQCGFQRPWLFRNAIAETTFKIPESQLRLITGDIGGSYGLRGSIYPEIILMLWAARRVGRPVKWLATRNEAHISDDDARDNIVDAALALDRDGKFLAVRIRSFGNLGAFVSFRGAMPPVVNIGTVCGVYTTPALHVAISGMLTNTHCTSPYRGAGRPEASYMIERLIDIAADEMKIDPAELRRRNIIPPSAMPYKTPLTFTYDSGRFEENMNRAMTLGDWSGFETRRKEAATRGMLRGIGMSNTIEQAADPTIETAEIRFDPLGGMTFVTGSISHGQGHATIQTQILVDRLGVDPDSDQVHSGRHRGCGVRHGHRRLALHHDERRRHRHGGRQGHRQGQEACGAYARSLGGRSGIQGRPLHYRRHRPRHGHPRGGEGRVPARQAAARHGARPLRDRDLPRPQRKFSERRPCLRGRNRSGHRRDQHGRLQRGRRRRYRHQPDAGQGPDHGRHRAGHGSGADGGQGLRSADRPGAVRLVHGLRHAARRELLLVTIEDNPVPTPTNPLGVKGAGEAGTVGSLSAGVNAIVDALSVYGIRHIDTPCTPFKVWQAIAQAKRRP